MKLTRINESRESLIASGVASGKWLYGWRSKKAFIDKYNKTHGTKLEMDGDDVVDDKGRDVCRAYDGVLATDLEETINDTLKLFRHDDKALTKDDIIEDGEYQWVRTAEDKKVWDSLSDDDKYLISMSDDMGTWFDDVSDDEDIYDRWYELASKFSKFVNESVSDNSYDGNYKALKEHINRKSSGKTALHESWDDFDKYSEIVKQYLPATGEGDTFASQVVTAINKLVYKWFNDGDVYDNTYILEGWANDLSSYANWLWKYVPDTHEELSRIADAWNDRDYEEILQDLCHFYLDEETLDEYAQQQKQGTIYNCDGPFTFIDKPYDYYDDDEEGEEEWDRYYGEVNDWHDKHPLA